MSQSKKLMAYWTATQAVLLVVTFFIQIGNSGVLRNLAIGGLVGSLVCLLILFRIDRIRYD